MPLWNNSPCLVAQLGPFKPTKNDMAKIRNAPWRGGGLAAGSWDGQAHQGHAEHLRVFNLPSQPMIWPKMDYVPSVVTQRDIRKSSRRNVRGSNEKTSKGIPGQKEQKEYFKRKKS
jgi:hypothetical protein